MENNQDKTQEKKTKRKIVILIILLLMLLSISFCLLGYLLAGLTGGVEAGKMVDSIDVSGNFSESRVYPFSLAFDIVDENGNTIENCWVEISGKYSYCYTKDNTNFFYDVHSSTFTLTVYSETGSVLATQDISILSVSGENVLLIKSENQTTTIAVSTDVLFANMVLQVSNGSITVDEEISSAVSTGGAYLLEYGIYDLNGDAVAFGSDNILLPDGSTIVGEAGVLLSDGTFVGTDGYFYSEDSKTSLLENESSLLNPKWTNNTYFASKSGTDFIINETSDGCEIIIYDGGDIIAVLQGDGTIVAFEKTTLNGDFTVTTEDSYVIDIGSGLVITAGGDTVYVTGEETSSSSGSSSSSGVWISSSGGSSSSSKTESTILWTNETTVDIFADATGTISPGSKVTYTFQLKNTGDYLLNAYISFQEVIYADLSETDGEYVYLPIEYKLYDSTGAYYIGDENTYVPVTEESEHLVESTVFQVLANSTKEITLEWYWNPSDNAVDTSIGMGDDLNRYIDIIIYSSTTLE